MMSLKNEFAISGNWLFKHRSYLPLIILPLLFYSLFTPVGISFNLLFYVGLSTSLLGECIRIITVAFVPTGTSGRNTKQQKATSLNQTGIYSIVRHPLYLGNFLIFLGPFIFTGNIYSIIIFILSFWIYYERIMYAEETFLISKFGSEYENWSSKTPAFIPYITSYTPTQSTFSFRKELEGEYSGIYGVFVIFTLLLAFRNYNLNITPIISNAWKGIFLGNTLIYITLRTLKKRRRND